MSPAEHATATSVERQGPCARVHLRGDLDVDHTPGLYRQLVDLAGRGDVREVVIDFAEAGRIDSSAVATVSIGSRLMADAGKGFDLHHLGDSHRAAFEMLPTGEAPPDEDEERPGLLERVGERLLAGRVQLAGVSALMAEAGREAGAVLLRRRRMPSGSVITQAALMGADALSIVALLSFLLGMTLAFQGAVQLEQFGADVYVADLVGLAMVREFGPLMTAIILTGRTGAAIAAELGTMRVRDEVSALEVMGVSPIRYLVLPRLTALSVVQPALTLLSVAVGIGGGMVIAAVTMDLSPVAFWDRMAERVLISDFGHGLGKSLVFAWIIGLTGSVTGLAARGGASSVGAATTRAVVTSIFLIVVVDSVFATMSAMGGPRWSM